MADNITGNSFASFRKPAWHRIGTVYTDRKNAVDAFAICGVDRITLSLRRLGWMADDGQFAATDQVGIFRDPMPDDLRTKAKHGDLVQVGAAGDRYTILQNAQIARMLDAPIGASNRSITDRFRVETVGALGHGETLFVCLDAGEHTLAGEDHHSYYLITDTRDGGSALIFKPVETRVVCANTLMAALGEQGATVSLQHVPSMEQDFRFTLDVIETMQHAQQQVRTALETLHTIRVRADQIEKVMERTYPEHRKGHLQRQFERTDDQSVLDPAHITRLTMMIDEREDHNRRQGILRKVAAERLDVLGQEFPHFRPALWNGDYTGLGVLNAITEVADHTRTQRNTAGAVLGQRSEEKLRAYKALVSLS